MFNVGDLVIYSSIGICRIDDICEKTFFGKTRNYYVVHPVENKSLTIHCPVDHDKADMLGIMDRTEAVEMISSFKLPGVRWIEKGHERNKVYHDILKSGNRKEISKVLNTLIRKKLEAERYGKKLCEQDRKLLSQIQNILFKELAIALDTSFDAIEKDVYRFIKLQAKTHKGIFS